MSCRSPFVDLQKIGTFPANIRWTTVLLLRKAKPRVIQVIPLIADDIRLKALISDIFNENAASKDTFNHIVTAMQMKPR